MPSTAAGIATDCHDLSRDRPAAVEPAIEHYFCYHCECFRVVAHHCGHQLGIRPLAIAGTSIRTQIVAIVGERVFRVLFSMTSLALIVWLVSSYGRTGPVRVLWVTPHWLILLCMVLMLPALVLLVGSVTVPNPTIVAGQRALRAEHPARGILRVSRHPMLWSFAIWAAVHMVMQGTLAAAIFFGAFLIVALAGMPSLDAKIAKRDPQRWAKFADSTSIMPFAAIAQGRERFVFSEIGVWPFFVALILWFALIVTHQWLFHIPAWNILLGS